MIKRNGREEGGLNSNTLELPMCFPPVFLSSLRICFSREMRCFCQYKTDRTCWVHLDSVLDVQRDNLLSIVNLEHCVATHWWIAHPITFFRGKCVERVLRKCYLSFHFFSTPASSTVWLFATTPMAMHFHSGRLSLRDTPVWPMQILKCKKNWNNAILKKKNYSFVLFREYHAPRWWLLKPKHVGAILMLILM
jgi:hypothetical protein